MTTLNEVAMGRFISIMTRCLPVFACVALLFIAACGSSADDSAPPPPDEGQAVNPPPPIEGPPPVNPPPPIEGPPPPIAGPPPATSGTAEEDYVVVDVFYGTDRRPSGLNDPRQYYGGERGVLQVGTVQVSIPKGHTLGALESPAWWRLEFKEDPNKHVVLQSVRPQAPEAMFEALRATVARSTRRQAFVFIHGYNVSFSDAARRTAQLAYDLNFDGAPVLYSWPSNGEVLSYTSDEADVAWSAPNLRRFLEAVAAESGAEQIHLIAHSMGNRALTSALVSLAADYDRRLFNQVVLAAPDIDADIFVRDIAPAITGTAQQVTLYASSQDKALMASHDLHGYPRAGDSGVQLVVAAGIETVDASGIDTSLLGHAYFAETAKVLQDLFMVIRDGLLPPQRCLQPRQKNNLTYWLLPEADTCG